MKFKEKLAEDAIWDLKCGPDELVGVPYLISSQRKAFVMGFEKAREVICDDLNRNTYGSVFDAVMEIGEEEVE